MTSDPSDLPPVAVNLRRLRTGAGKTQEQLADEAELSRAGYRNIELGISEPKEETLYTLAKVLRVPVRELLTAPVVLHRVRFRSLKRLKRREDVLHEVGRWLRDYSELEELLDARVPNKLKALEADVKKARKAGIPAVAKLVRNAFELNEKEPVHDICGLLEARGVKVHSVVWESDAFFGLSVADDDGGPAVIVNAWERLPVEAWIFSAAHELCHLLLHIGSYQVDDDKERDEEEHEANEFASHFLMPDAAFRKEWEDTRGFAVYDRVLKVKRIFRVSWRTVVYRLAQGLPVEERNELWRYVSGEHRLRTGQSLTKHDEPDRISESWFQRGRGAEPAKLDAHDFVDDRMQALVRRAVDDGKISIGRAAEVLGVDRKKMREIAASWFG
jgi:Zn-dependent peptidase ImmA (M78 family)/DNA-binding XRE family transcriptional regulator